MPEIYVTTDTIVSGTILGDLSTKTNDSLGLEQV